MQINVIHAAVGQISKSDVLAAAEHAIIVGFQVRPSASARRAGRRRGENRNPPLLDRLRRHQKRRPRTPSRGMLEPVMKKKENRGFGRGYKIFKITKVGTVAGVWSVKANCGARPRSASSATLS